MNSELMYESAPLPVKKYENNKVTDSHFHFHNEGLIRWGVKELLQKFTQLEPLFSEHEVTKLYAVFLPHYKSLPDTIKDEYKGVKSGLYLVIGDEPRQKLEESGCDFDFIKIRGLLIDDPLMAQQGFMEIIDKCVKLGYDKFQVCTTTLTQNQINLLKKYTETGLKFYLVHGADSLRNSRILNKPINYEELKSEKGRLFLGTSYSIPLVFEPMENVTHAIKNGLENMLCFETNHLLNYDTRFYNAYFKSLNITIPFNPKIMRENSEAFIK
jgi:hypothetical protein